MEEIKTWCYVANAKNILNFDVAFPMLDDSVFKSAAYVWRSYIVYDKEYNKSEVRRTKLFRCRLKGVMLVDGAADHDIKLAKFDLVKMCKLTGRIFMCTLSGIDNYNRIWIDLYYPIIPTENCDRIWVNINCSASNESISVAETLINTHADVVRKFK